MPLLEYILENYESRTAFAESQNVSKTQVNIWIRDNFIVLNGKLYSPRRPIIK